MSDTIYIFDIKYEKNKFPKSAVDDLKNCKIKIRNNNFNKDETVNAFKVEDKYITPQFVGVLYIENTRIVSLPKHLQNVLKDDEDKKKEENKLLNMMWKYQDEIAVRDPLFNTVKDFFYNQILIEQLNRLYTEYGPYVTQVKKLQSKKGRISWSNTVKKVTPVLINGSPIYTDFVYQAKFDMETEITKLERSILKLAETNQSVIADSEYEYYDRSDLEDRRDYFIGIINNELSRVFDDVKLEKLDIMKKYLIRVNISDESQKISKYKDLTEEKKSKIIQAIKNNEKFILLDAKYSNDSKDKKYIFYELRLQLRCDNNIEFLWSYQFESDTSGEQIIRKALGKEISISNNTEKYFSKFEIESDEVINNDLPAEDFKMYAVAKFDFIFEVLLQNFFSEKSKIDIDKISGNLTFVSEIFDEKICNLNDASYRPYKCNVTNNVYKEYSTNYIDIAIDGVLDNEKYCVIIDAKDYGYGDNRQELPRSEAVFKQFYYQDIMERMYRGKKVLNITIYNLFVLPYIRKNKEDKFDGEFIFDGHISDGLNKKTIFIARIDMDILVDTCLYGKNSKTINERRRALIQEFRKRIKIENSVIHEGAKISDEICYDLKLVGQKENG